jgi:hypothetical protein
MAVHYVKPDDCTKRKEHDRFLNVKAGQNAQLTVRLDEQLKKRAELRLEAMGMTATEAVEQLYRFIADHGRMPVTERIVI